MIRVASDKTGVFLLWFFLLGFINLMSTEKLPVSVQTHVQKIDLNSAALEDLMQIPRLSFKTAQSILEERNKRGSFRSLAELKSVSGVGPKILEKLERFACVGCS